MPGLLSLLLPAVVASTVLPSGAQIDSIEIAPPRAIHRLTLPAEFVAGDRFDELFVERLVRECLLAYDDRPEIRACDLRARAGAEGSYRPIPALLPTPPPVPERPWERARIDAPAVDPPGRLKRLDEPGDAPVQGALSGMTVYVSGGHGWYYNSSLDAWITQRGHTHELVEDLSNAESVNEFFIPLLRHAGADVVPVREEDRNPHQVVVDDSGGEGDYREEGRGNFMPGAALGFAPPRRDYEDGDNPFEAGETRRLLTDPAGGSAFVWTPLVPERGRYTVYVSYEATGASLDNACYEIRHVGGLTQRCIDQRRRGATWVRLGNFAFDAGLDRERGSVRLSNVGPAGRIVSGDAIRLGGGMSHTRRGDRLSERPRWEEAARYSAQYNGAPSSVYDVATRDNSDDVSSRSRFADWHHEAGEEAVFVSWHSNAPSPGRGTSTFVYGPNAPDGSYNFTGTAGSDRLGRLIHDEMIADIQAAWDPSWRDRGVFSAYFGEINPRHNDEMPQTLLEVAFHATEADAAQMRDPKWRYLVARAVTQGVIRFRAEQNGGPVFLPPEPPVRVHAMGDGPDGVIVRWTRAEDASGAAGDDAEGFIIERSLDGLTAWAVEAETAFEEVRIGGLSAGNPIYLRVRGRNAGGVSGPSEVVGASAGFSGRQPRALIINGFDRFDAFTVPREDLEARNLGQVARVFPERINSFDYVIPHGSALNAAGTAFDASSNEAVMSGALTLENYALVVWIGGRESTVDESLSSAEQQRLTAYLDAGGALFISGSEIAWDLGARGNAADTDFLAQVLGAAYDLDSSDVWLARGTAGGPFAGLSARFDDGSDLTGGVYAVGFPDVLETFESEAVFDYDTLALPAGVRGTRPNRRIIYLGFPFETILEAGEREALMAAAVADLIDAPITPTPTPEPSAEVTPTPDPSARITPTPGPTGEATPAPSPTPGVTRMPETSPSAAPSPEISAGPTPGPTPTPDDGGGGGNPGKKKKKGGGCAHAPSTGAGPLLWLAALFFLRRRHFFG